MGLVHLERLFNSNDVVAKPIEQEIEVQVVDCNIGSEKDPQIIKLAKGVPHKYKQRYLDLLKNYMDVFAWSYDDLKTFDTSIIQHKIPLKGGVKPYKQKLRQINPLLLPSIGKEVRRLLYAKIIVSLRYSDWVANLVPIRKKMEK